MKCFLTALFLTSVFYSPNLSQYSVPEWAKRAVWYQIFPERFRNGDTTNDPELVDILGSWPHDSSSNYHVSDWTGDWYALQSWEKPEKGDFYYHVQRRRYGGDLQGVIDKLDYLQDLGITAIYFNPLFESPSMHKYDGASYHHIDDNFGPDPAGDKKLIATEDPIDPATWQWTSADSLFLNLIEACHNRNIRVIIDGVFNHVGLNFWAFKDVVKNQENSRYKDWFIIKKWDDPGTPENEFDYEGWAGVKELPEIREDEHGILPEPRQYIFHAVKRWMDPNNDGDPREKKWMKISGAIFDSMRGRLIRKRTWSEKSGGKTGRRTKCLMPGRGWKAIFSMLS